MIRFSRPYCFIERYVDAYRLAMALEKEGAVSIVLPPSNFMVSSSLDADDAKEAERILGDYAKLCWLGMRLLTFATTAAKLVSVVVATTIALDFLW